MERKKRKSTAGKKENEIYSPSKNSCDIKAPSSNSKASFERA